VETCQWHCDAGKVFVAMTNSGYALAVFIPATFLEARPTSGIARYPLGKAEGFPVMEVGIEIGKINKNKQKEKNLRNSYLGDEHTENSRCLRIWPA
jgi:hypothetical protein